MIEETKDPKVGWGKAISTVAEEIKKTEETHHEAKNIGSSTFAVGDKEYAIKSDKTDLVIKPVKDH